MEPNPERSTIEIKNLLLKLNPRNGSHKDRVRALTKFRNYVAGSDKKSTSPEFYDDDLPLLFLGSKSPIGLYDADTYGDINTLFGLLPACATPSSDHSGGLKRSARNAMNLLKYLVIDFQEMKNGKKVPIEIDPVTGLPELNPFADALCTLKPEQLLLANFEQHLKETKDTTDFGNQRGGARSDACEVLLLLFSRHYVSDGAYQQSGRSLVIGDLLLSPQTKQEFENWMVKNATKDQQQLIKSKAYKRASESKSIENRKGNDEDNNIGVRSALNPFADDVSDDNMESHGNNPFGNSPHETPVRSDQAPIRWEESKLAQLNIQLNVHNISEVNHDFEKDRRHQEKLQKMLRKDPLNIRPDNFDLHYIQEKVVELLQESINDLENEISEYEPDDDIDEMTMRRRKKKDKFAYNVDELTSLASQKCVLQAILEGKRENDEQPTNADQVKSTVLAAKNLSILPSDSNFNPMLFLTMVHKNTSYDELVNSIKSLDNQIDDQMEQIQSRVRANVDLYLRCANGIDLFSDRAGKGKIHGPGVHKQIEQLQGIAEKCSLQATKSFKPLLDNTAEVRKVQSALSVLSRIGPILQVPAQMRQHMENGRYNEAIKSYRKVIDIDERSNIDVLRHVKVRAAESAREAMFDLECRLASPTLPIQSILESIRDLSDLMQLDVPKVSDGGENKDHSAEADTLNEYGKTSVQVVSPGTIRIGKTDVNIRDFPTSLACLKLQAAHFSEIVIDAIEGTNSITKSISQGQSIERSSDDSIKANDDGDLSVSAMMVEKNGLKFSMELQDRNRLRYDIFECRVQSLNRIISIIRTWLPRLLTVSEAARHAEKVRIAHRFRKRFEPDSDDTKDRKIIKTFEAFVNSVYPSLKYALEHAAFCCLGSIDTDGKKELRQTYGSDASESLLNIIKSPLPVVQTSKCASEFANLTNLVLSISESALNLRPTDAEYYSTFERDEHHKRNETESMLEETMVLSEDFLITIERRKCSNALEQCAKSCSMRASGTGVFDCASILSCLRKLSQELSRSESCGQELERGIENVVQKCCEGLGAYVRDRNDAARLRAISECASALHGTLKNIALEVSYLTNTSSPILEDNIVDNVLALEDVMFEEFLSGIRKNMSSYCKLGPMVIDDDDEYISAKRKSESQFPSYLSASLLAIVRCRAQVENALGSATIRQRSNSSTYLLLAMSTASDSLVDAICYEISQRMPRMIGTQAERLSYELQFLQNTLRRYLSDQVIHAVDNCRSKLAGKTESGVKGHGPDGLAAIERLERLGRLYVMCLGD